MSHLGRARPRWWRRHGTHAAALSLALTAAARGLTATPAWAAGGYHITATIRVGNNPAEVGLNPAGTRAYVTNVGPGTVSVINTATNKVTATIRVGGDPDSVAVSPDGTRAYVTNDGSGSASVISTPTNRRTATIRVGSGPDGVAVSPGGTHIYVVNQRYAMHRGTVSVITRR